MANFQKTYTEIILPNEGGYANVVGDKGGETYAGIARNFHPNWEGWTYIDFQKRTKYVSGIPRNTKFPDIAYAVEEFYLNLWNIHRIGEIVSQNVASLLFDYIVHSDRYAIKSIQRILGVTADGIIGPRTLAAINNANAYKLYNDLLKQRTQFLIDLSKNPNQQQFLAGWLNRMNFLASLNTGNVISLLIVALIIYLVFTL